MLGAHCLRACCSGELASNAVAPLEVVHDAAAAELPERAQLMAEIFGSDYEDSDVEDEVESEYEDADSTSSTPTHPPVFPNHQCVPCNPSTHLSVVLGGCFATMCWGGA